MSSFPPRVQQLQMIAVRDIGIVAAAAMVDRSALGATALEIAGDELTGEQIAAAVGEHLGRAGRHEALPADAAGDAAGRLGS